MNDRKTELIGIRVTPDQKSQIIKLANKEGRTISNYVLKLILDAIKE
ncbi:plasmid mobilization protein [Deinococcus ficus]